MAPVCIMVKKVGNTKTKKLCLEDNYFQPRDNAHFVVWQNLKEISRNSYKHTCEMFEHEEKNKTITFTILEKRNEIREPWARRLFWCDRM